MAVLQSLRFRLIAVASVWMVVALSVGFLALSHVFRTQVEAEFDDELIVHSEELERITRFNRERAASDSLPFSDPRYDDPRSGFYWEVQGADGVLFASSSLQGRRIGPLPQDADPSRQPWIATATGPSGPMIAIARFGPESEGRLRFVLATDLRHIEAAVREFDGLLFLALASLGGVVILSALGLVTIGMAPFSRLAQAMRDVRAGATLGVEGNYPAEVQPLVTELNTLIKGQRDTLQRARAQAGNLAHALKGPLAIAADEAFQLDQRGQVKSASTIADQCKAMQLHIDHHIARARAQVVSRLPGTQANVAEIVAGVVSALSRLHIRKGVQVDQRLDGQVRAAMDGQDLSELIANLIDNAFKFAEERILVSVEAIDDIHIRVTVEDDGPGLPAEAREIVFSPGVRLDETRPGTGLGLSIVRDLLELYGGEIELQTSSLGGLSASLRLKRHV
jgi:signal transduction histidine kinase